MREESEDEARDESDERGEDQKELLVSDVARLRVDVELRVEALLRTEDVLFAVFDRDNSFRCGFGVVRSSSTSGDGGGDG